MWVETMSRSPGAKECVLVVCFGVVMRSLSLNQFLIANSRYL